MGLNALLLCAERHSLKVLEAVLDELEIGHEVCQSSGEAMERAVRGHYSALVLDFDVEGAAQIGKLARMAGPQRRSVLFALVGTSTSLSDTCHAGANVVLYKPLEVEPVRCSLRAGRELMRSDRRQTSRHRVETLVYLQLGIAAMPALVLDLSEQGLALQTPEPFPPVREVRLRFALPAPIM
jgi:DNA-binding NtrC family response regulator